MAQGEFATEGPENDVLSIEEFEDIFDAVRTQESKDDPFLKKFDAFFDTIGAKHFSSRELLFMGGGHYGTGKCNGLNGYPEEDKWDGIKSLVPVLDEIRGELGHSIRLTSIYRNTAYNKCIGGVETSFHRRGIAADCIVNAVSVKDLHEAAMRVRNRGTFRGGIGLYPGFVHIDVRGQNANWTG